MKTYAESKTRRAFDWNTALRNAIDGSQEDRYKMTTLAANWITCACGNLCSVIPRDHHGAPLDKDLRELGAAFYNRVGAGDYETALETLQYIEARSQVLLEEIYKTCPKLDPSRDYHNSTSPN